MSRRKSISERLADNTVPSPDGCLLWTGRTDAAGYGRMTVTLDGVETTIGAHRAAWEEANGPIPQGMNVNHSCDVRNCVAVEHLYVGTQAENVGDMAARGRAWWQAEHDRRSSTCRKGHDDWIIYSGRRRCRPCYAEYRAEWEARRGA